MNYIYLSLIVVSIIFVIGAIYYFNGSFSAKANRLGIKYNTKSKDVLFIMNHLNKMIDRSVKGACNRSGILMVEISKNLSQIPPLPCATAKSMVNQQIDRSIGQIMGEGFEAATQDVEVDASASTPPKQSTPAVSVAAPTSPSISYWDTVSAETGVSKSEIVGLLEDARVLSNYVIDATCVDGKLNSDKAISLANDIVSSVCSK